MNAQAIESETCKKALSHYQAGRYKKAAGLCNDYVSKHPSDPVAWQLLGLCSLASGSSEEAERQLGQAAVLKPSDWRIHLNLGAAQNASGKPALAVRTYHLAQRLNPASPDIHFNLGNAYMEMGLLADAETQFDRYIEARPDEFAGWLHMGRAQLKRGRLRESALSCEEVLERDADNHEALVILAEARIGMGQVDEGADLLDRVLKQAPERSDVNWARARLTLMQGNYKKGWPAFVASYGAHGAEAHRHPELPLWNGKANQTLLLDAGMSRTEVLRWWPALDAVPQGQTALRCHKDLHPLIQRLHPQLTLLDASEAFQLSASYLSWASMELAAGLIGLKPGKSQSLQAESASQGHWRQRLSAVERSEASPLIALAWRAEQAPLSFPFRTFAPLVQGPEARYLAVQSLTGEAPSALGCVDISSDVRELEGLLAALGEMDLVICTDSPVAHLAAASGIETWVVLPALHHWSWGSQDEACPWYPNIRLFRQKQLNDWQWPISQVLQALKDRANS